VCGCGAGRGGWSSSGSALVAEWCVCGAGVVVGTSPSRLLLMSHKAMRACRPQAEKIIG